VDETNQAIAQADENERRRQEEIEFDKRRQLE